MEKTGEGLCDYARKKLGTPYFFGAKMQLLTEEFMQTMHRKYPSVVTEQYMEMAIHRGLPGRVCCDCSGLIAGYTGRSFGTAQLYASASLRMSVETIDQFPAGTLLWKKGHVAVFIGYMDNMPCCIESRSLEHGCCLSKIAGRGFTHGLLLKDFTYSEPLPSGSAPSPNIYPIPTDILLPGEEGNQVKWLQHALFESGYDLSITGVFDDTTRQALIAYQNTSDIYHEPGYLGFSTLQALKNTL